MKKVLVITATLAFLNSCAPKQVEEVKESLDTVAVDSACVDSVKVDTVKTK